MGCVTLTESPMSCYYKYEDFFFLNNKNNNDSFSRRRDGHSFLSSFSLPASGDRAGTLGPGTGRVDDGDEGKVGGDNGDEGKVGDDNGDEGRGMLPVPRRRVGGMWALHPRAQDSPPLAEGGGYHR